MQGGGRLNFEEHIRILLFFLIGLAITFIIAFTLDSTKLWLSVIVVITIFGAIIIVLSRSKDDIGKTD